MTAASPIYASDIALAGAGLAPDGVPYTGAPTSCSHCGKPIASGDLYEPVKLGPFFSDTRHLAAGTGIVCGNCVVLRRKSSMNAFSFAVATRSAVYPIAKHVHKAWLILTPPEPPFVAVHSSATMQHLVWRTPPTLSKELIVLRRGQDLLRIRPARVREALALCTEYGRRVLEVEPTRPHAPAHPYAKLDARLDDGAHGLLSARATRFLTPAEMRVFQTLSPGEVWSLSFLATRTPTQPEQPEPLNFTKTKD